MSLFLLSALLAGAATPIPAHAQSVAIERSSAHRYADLIAEASQRFGIPKHWIRAVMQVESGGRVNAVSTAGAMGLMQIMPGTWTELRLRHRLGNDPFEPRDNILGGTAYLREMYDLFGAPGFLAAYNAGPARYADHLATGRALPRETRVYVAMLAPMIGSGLPTDSRHTALRPTDWRDAALFVAPSDGAPTTFPAKINRQPDAGPRDQETHALAPFADRPDGIFVTLSRSDPSQ
ncbi:lytic transglycosylase domain-containing protein [uncultured Sulfitobacter sp.]|uniref:lytic transglycosylase domain-containing protein n=1 Tax=uncultured Sulfitobacter sp. TaxID=191468 RepID=UPI0030D944E2